MTARSITGLVMVGLLALSGSHSSVLEPSGELLGAAPGCDPLLHQRTPEQVVTDFRAAMVAANWAAVRCNLDDDAVMISDGAVTNGEDEIVGELQAMAAFFGGSVPQQMYQTIIVPILGGNRSMARVLYTVDTACSDVPDGIDTCVIKGGQIAALTTHGYVVFGC